MVVDREQMKSIYVSPFISKIPTKILTLAVLSFEAVIKYVLSGAHCRSVTCMPSS